MIISPPFLPPRSLRQSDAAWVDEAMKQPASRAPHSGALEGSFPLSASLMWHNGIHIQAPQTAGAYPDARAIASGTVIYAKAGKTANSDPADAQNYTPFSTQPAWTDNGIVVIEHEAEIGATNDVAAMATSFRFCSLYMHLGSIAINPASKKPWTAGDAIHRKDSIGQPGQIYGHAGQIHFEICCDEANVGKILKRAPQWEENDPCAVPTKDGRTDAVFGSIFVYLPMSTPVSVGKPKIHIQPPVVAGQSVGTQPTLGQPQWVEIVYGLGDALITSLSTGGRSIGAALSVKDAEYGLYPEACARHRSLDAATQVKSSPSGWYELLRFGRNLGHGIGADPLPTDAAHWREIPTATGTTWVDLNATGTFKFSDADFLAVAGWSCFNDDPDSSNQLCESTQLRRLLRDPVAVKQQQQSGAARMVERDDRRDIARRLDRPELRTTLRRAICSFPTEWERATIERRHQWTRTKEEGFGLEDEANWTPFSRHLRALSFDDLPKAYAWATWRFHPGEFITQFRKCGWISAKELAEIYPDKFYNSRETPNPDLVRERFRIHINRAMRRYFVVTGTRQSHFFGQGAIESFFLARMIEASVDPPRNLSHPSIRPETGGYYNNSNDRYFDKYDYRLGNINPGDGMKFRGRGMKQLTALENYSKYWLFRGWLPFGSFQPQWWDNTHKNTAKYKDASKSVPSINDPQRIGIDHWSCIDAGAWYWEAGSTTTRFRSINRHIEEGKMNSIAISSITFAINGAQNGLADREIQTKRISFILMDMQ